jgi:hypothetical protein
MLLQMLALMNDDMRNAPPAGAALGGDVEAQNQLAVTGEFLTEQEKVEIAYLNNNNTVWIHRRLRLAQLSDIMMTWLTLGLAVAAITTESELNQANHNRDMHVTNLGSYATYAFWKVLPLFITLVVTQLPLAWYYANRDDVAVIPDVTPENAPVAPPAAAAAAPAASAASPSGGYGSTTDTSGALSPDGGEPHVPNGHQGGLAANQQFWHNKRSAFFDIAKAGARVMKLSIAAFIAEMSFTWLSDFSQNPATKLQAYDLMLTLVLLRVIPETRVTQKLDQPVQVISQSENNRRHVAAAAGH